MSPAKNTALCFVRSLRHLVVATECKLRGIQNSVLHRVLVVHFIFVQPVLHSSATQVSCSLCYIPQPHRCHAVCATFLSHTAVMQSVLHSSATQVSCSLCCIPQPHSCHAVCAAFLSHTAVMQTFSSAISNAPVSVKRDYGSAAWSQRHVLVQCKLCGPSHRHDAQRNT